MITSGMSTSEILKEFWKDYENTITPRLMGWIKGHSKEIKNKKQEWVELKEPRLVKINGNIYRNAVKAKIQKNGEPAFIATSYIITTDSISGRNIIHLLPQDKHTKALISFDSHFFYRWADLFLGHNDTFQNLVDKFMKTGVGFSVKTTSDWKEYDPNFQVDLGFERIGIGRCNLDEGRFVVNTCVRKDIIEEWRNELNLPAAESYINIYTAHKNKNKESRINIPELPKTDKEKEIEQAWKEWEEMRR